MKAAVLFPQGGTPHYVDYPEPTAQNSGQLVLTVNAAALKHLDRSQASGTHYSAAGNLREAVVIGGDGVGVLPDGRRVYALASGMMAEKALVEPDRLVPVPDGLDDVTAAALPNAFFGSAMALRFRARLQPGETVLINGATSFTGKLAVQLARHLGAGRIIATGRDEQALAALRELGADELVPLQQDDAALTSQLQRLHAAAPFAVIIDYLWGHSAELLLASLRGKGSFTPRTRFVSVGSITGDLLQLSAATLRSVDLQLSGSGLGSWTRAEVQEMLQQMLPEAFQLAAEGRLRVDTTTVPLANIEHLWDQPISSGQRLVVTM